MKEFQKLFKIFHALFTAKEFESQDIAIGQIIFVA